MKIELLDQINVPSGDKPSEDCVGYNLERGSFWVIDGMTSIYPKDEQFLRSDPSDAYWAAQTLNMLFRDAARDGTDSGGVEFFEIVLRGFRNRFASEVDLDHNTLDSIRRACLPCATGIWAHYREYDRKILTVRASDCEAHILTDAGMLFSNADIEEKRKEFRLNRETAEKARRFSLDDPDTLEALRDERDLINAGGKWCFSIHPEAAAHFDRRDFRLPENTGATLLLASDGFLRLVDVFEAYTHEGLIRAAMPQEKGLEALVIELRDLENKAIAAGDTRQVKGHDDASALLLRIEP